MIKQQSTFRIIKKGLYWRVDLYKFFFLLSEFSFMNIHDSHYSRGRRRLLLHRHLDISWVITAESSTPYIASSRSRTENLGFWAQVTDHFASCPKLLDCISRTTLTNFRIKISKQLRCLIAICELYLPLHKLENQKQLFPHSLQSMCFVVFWKIHRKTPALESLINKVPALGLQLY